MVRRLKGPLTETIGQGSVTSYIPASILAPDNRFPLNTTPIARDWPSLAFGRIERFLEDHGFARPDVFYLDNFYHAPLHDRIAGRRSIYHMADDYSAFPGYSEAFRAQELRLCQSVDCVLYPSLEMTGLVESLLPKSMHFLPNGVDYPWFSQTGNALPTEYEDIPSPRLVYVGAIEGWFDFDLVRRAALAHPHVSFVLIGKPDLAMKNLADIANVYVLGVRGREELKGYLEHAQAGMIPFDVAAYPELLNPVRPLKLLEYMSAGLPTLSVAWQELRNMNSPCLLSESSDEFVDLVPVVCEMQRPQPGAQAYAREHDWDDIFASMMSLLTLDQA